MIEFVPGNTKVVAFLIQQHTDPTEDGEPAVGLSNVVGFITTAPIGKDDSIDDVALVQAIATEGDDFTDEDDRVWRKYLATFTGAENRAPFSDALGSAASKQVYVYVSHGTELLDPELGVILAVQPVRR